MTELDAASQQQGPEIKGLVERLREIQAHDWRISFLAHTSDTAGEAADALSRTAPSVGAEEPSDYSSDVTAEGVQIMRDKAAGQLAGDDYTAMIYPSSRAPSPHKGEPGDDGKPLPYAWAWWGKDEASMWPVWSIGATRPTEAPLDAVALYATPQAPIPEGMVLVPREPTEAMIRASLRFDVSNMPDQQAADRAGIYRAMLAAATPAPQAEPGAGE